MQGLGGFDRLVLFDDELSVREMLWRPACLVSALIFHLSDNCLQTVITFSALQQFATTQARNRGTAWSKRHSAGNQH